MEPLLAIAKKLCRNLTGSQCALPRLSNWALVAPGQSSISVDVADVATGGAGAIAPVNVKVYGSYFTSGLEYNASSGGMSAYMYGYGAGAGAGAGWGIPMVGAKGVGKLPDAIKKKVIQAVGGAVQGKATDLLKGAAWGGISGGTRLVSGPDAGGELSISDFHDALVTIIGLGANFVVNGVSMGVIIISKQRPVLTAQDMIYATGIGLMGGRRPRDQPRRRGVGHGLSCGLELISLSTPQREARTSGSTMALAIVRLDEVVRLDEAFSVKYLFATICLMLATGCVGSTPTDAPASTSAEGGPSQSLCDGTAELKLRVFVAPQSAREMRGSVVRVENGSPAFLVDGQCNYWLGGGWWEDANSRNLGWRQGKVDAALRQAIEQAYPLHDLRSIQDCESELGVFDYPSQVIASQRTNATCRVPGPRFRAAWTVVKSRARELWDAGTPMSDGIWVMTAESEDGSEAYDWPLEQALSSLMLSEKVPEAEYLGFSRGVAKLITDSVAAQRLRALRERFLRDAEARPFQVFDAPKVTDGKHTARVYMRDAIPYEDARGLLPMAVSP